MGTEACFFILRLKIVGAIDGKHYLCNVFFMVLDLRLMKSLMS